MNDHERIAMGECVSSLTVDRCPYCTDTCEASQFKISLREIVMTKDELNLRTLNDAVMDADNPTERIKIIQQHRDEFAVNYGQWLQKTGAAPTQFTLDQYKATLL